MGDSEETECAAMAIQIYFTKASPPAGWPEELKLRPLCRFDLSAFNLATEMQIPHFRTLTGEAFGIPSMIPLRLLSRIPPFCHRVD